MVEQQQTGDKSVRVKRFENKSCLMYLSEEQCSGEEARRDNIRIRRMFLRERVEGIPRSETAPTVRRVVITTTPKLVRPANDKLNLCA